MPGCHSAARGKALTAAWISAAGAPAGPLQKLRRKAHLLHAPVHKSGWALLFCRGERCASPDHESRRVPRPGHDSRFWPDAAALVLPPQAGSGGLLACTHLFQAGARDGLSTDAGGHGPQDGLKNFFLPPGKGAKTGAGQKYGGGQDKAPARPWHSSRRSMDRFLFCLSGGVPFRRAFCAVSSAGAGKRCPTRRADPVPGR